MRDSEKETSVGSGWRWEDWAIFFLPTRLTPTPSPTFPPPLLCRKCTSLSTSILKGSSKLSNLSAILYIIARLNPHWNLGCYATIIWPLISSPPLHFLSCCFLSFQQGKAKEGVNSLPPCCLSPSGHSASLMTSSSSALLLDLTLLTMWGHDPIPHHSNDLWPLQKK